MKALCTGGKTDKEVKMIYKYVTDLRNHLETVANLACENLAVVQTQQAENSN